MNTLLLVSNVILWLVVALVAFLLLGTLRALGLLNWRVDQLEAITPSRIGRSGLKPGKKAPDFTLPTIHNGEVSLHDFAGRSILLVFVRSGCAPCHEIVPALNKLRRKRGDLAVLAINHANPQDAKHWADDTHANFPVLVQEDLSVSKRYEAFATPFAFLIDERGIIRSTGIAATGQHLGYVLSGARGTKRDRHAAAETEGAARGETKEPVSIPS